MCGGTWVKLRRKGSRSPSVFKVTMLVGVLQLAIGLLPVASLLFLHRVMEAIV